MSRTRRRPGFGQRPTAFRAAPSATPAARPSRRQALALLAVLALVAGTVVAVSYLVRPDRARTFDLFHGSVFLADSVAPVAVDLASGRPTVRLIDADDQVGARTGSDLAVTPLDQGTLLLNRTSGEFNLVAATGFVVKTDGGVPVAQRAGAIGATAISAGDLAYIEQTGPTGTSVYLVGQTTVETASNGAARVRPRAFRSMSEPGSTEPGAAASAAGSLWVLLGAGDQRVVRQLAVPSGSSTGATLRSTDHGQVNGPAALASAELSPTAATDPPAAGGSGDVIGVASATGIRVFQGTAEIGTARFPAIAGLDRVLAATNGQGRLSYLFHGSAGWSVASVGADGRGLRGPTQLTGLSDGAALATPAASAGSLYTMDTTNGQLVRIDADNRVQAISGAARYPLAEQGGRVVEPGGFADGYVIARGSRVIYNSPTHLDALAVFTDGSHLPLTIEKSSAVAVSAAGGADSLTRSRVDAAPRRTPTPVTQPRANNPVNNKIDCRTVRQKPHIPTIIAAVPGSRSVALTWTYPLLSPQDCAPSTYEVGVRVLSGDAPSPPSAVTVQGQQSVNLAGLFPSTQYEITVGAYINGQGTESVPRRVTTGPEGPAAPKGVRADTDSSGNWTVTWSSCGSARRGCVAAAAWKVVPEFCDGRGLAGAPSPISVTADPTSVTQPPAQLRGGDALLGRGLRFQVEGTGPQGTVGQPSGYTACTYSWATPLTAQLSLHASTKPLNSAADTTSATVTLDLGSNASRATGGVGAQFSYTLLSGGSPVRTIGPTQETSVSFDGIRPRQRYEAQASVAPPRHAEAAVTVGPVPLEAAVAPWPAISARVTAVDDTSSPSTATYQVQIAGVTSAAARGETFAVDGTLRCGNASDGIASSNIDPADPLTFTTDRTHNNFGTCAVQLRLTQSGSLTDPPLFGDGTSSAEVTTPTFDIAAPSLPALGDANFAAQWTSAGSSSAVQVTSGNVLVGQLGHDFDVVVTGPDGTRCGGYTAAATLQDVPIDQSCVDRSGASGDGWTVTVTHFDYGGTDEGPYAVNGIAGGAAPTYTAPVCDVGNAGLSATWSGSKTAPSVIVAAGSSGPLKSCSNWTYSVVAPSGDCGSASGAPAQTVPVTCSATPTENGWSVTISYLDSDGSSKTTSVTVIGDPPN
ncbi:fibronectin type III domain-containing protein [uncultured Jatrophihabitans sp.]|uniref:fibronectin type III domain-containing protein n=1 Tax=uncultured Jatrophihabitans sp. TaxID=1610747 RepID=UPI0035CA88B5